MTHDTCETVCVESLDPKSQGEFVRINKEDFNDKVHKLYQSKAPSAPPPAVTGPSYSDAVVELAKANNVDLSKVQGTGANGNVVVKDVKAFIKANEEPVATVDFASDEAGELAAELGLDAEKLKDCEGTGENGAITVEDLEKFVDESE